jgi:hypothetical protein
MEKYKRLALGVVSLVLIASIFSIYRSIVYRTEISEFDLKATIADPSGVSPDTRFILKSTAQLSTQVLEKYITFIPKVDLNISEVPGQINTYEIIPNNDLETDQVYTVKINKGPLASRDFSWAYQIKAPFQVTSSIPANLGVDVPVNSGIEIYFNRDEILNPEKYFEITPAVPGKFETSENKLVFIPNHPLANKTIYRIKVKAGLTAKGTSDKLENENVIQFQTRLSYTNINNPAAYFSRQFSEYNVGSDIQIGLSTYNTEKVTANVYRLGSAQELIDSVVAIEGDTPWARYYQDAETFFPESKRVFSGSLPTEKASYSSSLRLPQALQTGYYAIIVKTESNTDISWFQVSPTASFAAFAGSKSLVWLKNISTERNIPDVPLFFNGKQIGKTGVDGVVLFDTPSELIYKNNDSYLNYYRGGRRKFLIAKIPSGDLVIPIENEYGTSASISSNNKWWDYVSLNKNVYLPTDTVRFWAIEKSRQDDITGEEIDIKLSNPYWYDTQGGIVTYAETKVKVSDYNTLTGELSYSNLKPGTYELTFKKGDEVLSRQTVSVSAYIKPAYKLTLTPDKVSVFAGDTVTFKAKAELFDGTPASNTELSYSAYANYQENYFGKIKLNPQGEGSFTITPTYNSKTTYWPSYLTVDLKPTNSEEGQIETSSTVFVFGPKIDNTITQNQKNFVASFTLKSRAVAIKNESQVTPYWNYDDYLGDPIPGLTTNVDISEVIYIKNQTGTNYDSINKLTYPVYEYKTEYKPISSTSLISNQNGIAQLSFNTEKDKTYIFIFTAKDSEGHIVTDTRYVYGSSGKMDYEYQDSTYSLFNRDDNKNYKVGDTVNLRLQNYQGVAPPNKPGSYIFLSVNNGNLEYQVQDTPEFNTSFQNKNIPNTGVWPGWFSNGRFHNSYLQNISFDANERRLKVEVTKDKTSYKPGDNVNLNIKVTDKNNNPTKAEINLSALDEAVFSIRPDEKDIINDLYKDIYSQLIIRTSNMPPYGGGGAEKGGGDDGGARSKIEEMAIFKTVTTDYSGNANVQFKLPDNITSWRLTSQAVTKDLFAGKSINFIPVTLPFFIDATTNNTYLAGDKLTLRLRTFGTEANKGSVNYTVESPTLGFNKINKTGESTVEMPLGTLVSGEHKITVRADHGIFSDALIKTLKVIDSYFTKTSTKFYEGTAGMKIDNKAIGYTTLTFTSYGRGRLYNELKSMSYEWGIRLDQKGAKLIATKLLNSYYGEKEDEPDLPATKYQSYTGGLQLLPYSSDELELSAISAHIFDESIFNKNLLKDYFNKSLSDEKADSHRIVRALYGLTAFNEPVLTKLQSIKNDKTLTLKDKIFVALALDSIGSKEEARSYYKANIKPSLEIKASYAYVSGLSGDETTISTTLLTNLTTSLQEPESTKLAMYTELNYPKETLNNFEKLLYIKTILPTLDNEEVSFTYKAGEKRASKTLKNGESFSLTLSPQELASLDLSNIKGKLGITSSYEEQLSSMLVVKDSNLSLTRSYEVNDTKTNTFNDGDLVKVRLIPASSSNAPDGAYQIIDYLPSGLRAVDRESVMYYNNSYGGRVYPAEINDQKITFVVDRNIALPIYYFARVVSKGTYKAEPALLQSLRNLESTTISNEDSVTIK